MKDGLREAYALQLAALRALRLEIAQQDRRYTEIVNAVRDADEWATGGPVSMKGTGLCYDLLPPANVTHAFAAIQYSGGMCCDDDPPSREL